MGADLSVQDASRWSEESRAALRRGDGYPRGPLADLQLGGIVRIVPSHDDPQYPFLFNTSPLPDHAWLQGRMRPDEWRDLLTALSLVAVDSLLPLLRESEGYRRPHQFRSARTFSNQYRLLERVAPHWKARGLSITSLWVDDAPVLFAQPIPIPSPASADAAAMEPPAVRDRIQPQPRVTVAALPGSIAESAEGQPPGGPASSAEGVAALPAPLPPRFCPHCGTAVALLVDADTAKFCSQCGAKWK